MHKILIVTVIAIIPFIGTSHAGSHTAGANYSCFYDSNPGAGKYHYYFCGKQELSGSNKNELRCSGKQYKGPGRPDSNNNPNGDRKVDLLHLEVFTFATDTKDTYCCCGGTSEKTGTFIKAVHTTDCYTDEPPVEKSYDLGNGRSCKQLIYKTVCETEVTIGCENPEESCGIGYKWRNNECAPICAGDTVYASEYSNTCEKCETTAYQGIVTRTITPQTPPAPTDSADTAENDSEETSESEDTQTTTQSGTQSAVTVAPTERYCLKCDKDTEFFNREKKECIKKSNQSLTGYSKEVLKACWQCTNTDSMKACVKASGRPSDATVKTNCNIK